MGLLTGSLSFVRYHVEGEEPDPFWQVIDEKIRLFRFREIEGGSEESAMGWVGLDNLLDSEFAYAAYSVGDYLVLSFRMDKKAIPPALLKKHVMQEEQRIKTSTGRKRISRQELTEIRERMRLKLLTGSFPVPSVYDVCWCISKKWLIFTGTSTKVRGEFENYFKQCFDLELVPRFPWDAYSATDETAQRLLALEPAIFCR